MGGSTTPQGKPRLTNANAQKGTMSDTLESTFLTFMFWGILTDDYVGCSVSPPHWPEK